jgi:hypothetical protein
MCRLARTLMAVASLVAWLGGAGTARAAEQRPVVAALALERDPSAEDCLEAAVLSSGVEARLQRSVFGPQEGADVVVAVRLSRQGEGAFTAAIELRSEDGQLVGTREIATRAEHCSALDEALELAIALMVDITVDELPPPVPRAAPPRPAPPRTPITLPPRTPAPRQPWHFRAAVLAAAALGLLPAPAGGVRASFGVEPPSFFITELDFTWWPPESDSADAAGVRLRLAALGLYVCPVAVGPRTTRAWFCAGQEVGQLEASGFGFERNERRRRLSYDLGLRARFSQTVAGPFGLLLGVQALAPLSRDRFVAAEPGAERREVFRRPPLAAAAELGFRLDF